MTTTDPQSPAFPGVVGHGHAAQRLSRAIARGQLHHALTLVGPRGVGKATFVRGLACALHCTVAPAVGCGECSACQRIASGRHVGVEWIGPDESGASIKVAAARELANRLAHAPFEGPRHLVVFDPAEALTEQAEGALLKTLEEPNPGVHFALLATNLGGLLPTILSRSMVVRLGRLGDDEVRRIVQAQIESGADAVAADRLELAVHLAGGSAGVAAELALDESLDAELELLRQAARAAHNGAAAVFEGDGSPLWSAFAAAVGNVRTGRPARERAVAARTAALWLLHLRENLRGRPGLPGVPAVSDRAQALGQLDCVQALLESLDRNPNVRLALEQTLLSLPPATADQLPVTR